MYSYLLPILILNVEKKIEVVKILRRKYISISHLVHLNRTSYSLYVIGKSKFFRQFYVKEFLIKNQI